MAHGPGINEPWTGSGPGLHWPSNSELGHSSPKQGPVSCAGDVIGQTFTDEAGGFSVSSSFPGSFFLRAEGLGYESRVDGVFDLGEGGVLTVEFRLRGNPLLLDTLAVEVEGRVPKLVVLGSYNRQRIGFGTFLGPEELEKKPERIR